MIKEAYFHTETRELNLQGPYSIFAKLNYDDREKNYEDFDGREYKDT